MWCLISLPLCFRAPHPHDHLPTMNFYFSNFGYIFKTEICVVHYFLFPGKEFFGADRELKKLITESSESQDPAES